MFPLDWSIIMIDYQEVKDDMSGLSVSDQIVRFSIRTTNEEF